MLTTKLIIKNKKGVLIVNNPRPFNKVHNSAKVIDLKLKEARGGYLKQLKIRR